MDNPLTQEQIEELNSISQLPLDDQKKLLPGFLKSLNPEQLEYLKKQQQSGSCVFCMIAEGKIPARKIYEDDTLIGALEIHPANKGHAVLFTKKHYDIINQMDDVSHLFNTAKKISGVIYEAVKADGTNIVISNGAAAGQTVPHVAVHIIPRFKNDKVQLKWDTITMADEEMDTLQKNLAVKLKVLSETVKEPEEVIRPTITVANIARRIP